MSLNAYLFFDGNCREAFELYRSVFGGEYQMLQTFGDGPADLNVAGEEKDRIMHVALPVGSGVLMGSDSASAFGPPPVQGTNFAISIDGDSREHCDEVFARLSEGGTVTMPMQETFWGAYFGSWIDRFGVSWMISYELPREQGGESSPAPGGDMAEKTLKGSCLCKAVQFEISPPFIRFAHCYCMRCRKATGGAKSSNISVPPEQFRWISGEDVISRWDMPEARAFAIAICSKCNCPVARPTRDGSRMTVPAGSLDDDPGEAPSAHRYWDSRAAWAATDESHLPYED